MTSWHKQQDGTLPLSENIADDSPPVEQTVARREALERLFAQIKGRDGLVLLMLSEGYTAQDIAEELGLAVSYAYKLIANVRAKARELVGDVE